MKILLRRILGFWWWFWLAIWSLPFVIILSLIFWLGTKEIKRVFARFCYSFVPRWLCWPSGIRFETIGREKLEKGRQYIIVSNHVSVLDIFANPGTSPIHFKFLAKAEIKSIPVLGKIAAPFCVFVNRRDKTSRAKSFDRLVEAVEKDGSSILIYPEGTRNRTSDPLKEFYDGAFRIAIRTQTPIVVQTLLNSKFLGPPDDFFNVYPGTIQCIWHQPIPTKGMTLDDVPKLKECVREIMIQNLNHHATQSKRPA